MWFEIIVIGCLIGIIILQITMYVKLNTIIFKVHELHYHPPGQ